MKQIKWLVIEMWRRWHPPVHLDISQTRQRSVEHSDAHIIPTSLVSEGERERERENGCGGMRVICAEIMTHALVTQASCDDKYFTCRASREDTCSQVRHANWMLG